ncbi:MAG TPA: hypothetical protein VI981_03975 [Candidatus Paceibacterota bacterium]
MKTKTKFITLTVVMAVATFLLTHVIWPNDPSMQSPSSTLIPFFIILDIIESIAFGVGVSFVVWGRVYIWRFGIWRQPAGWAFGYIVWALVSWWPHDNFHRVIGMNLKHLLYVEYIFHVTLILGAMLAAYWFYFASHIFHDHH